MAPLLFIGSIGIPETIVILVVGLLVFGSRLPEVGRSMGRGLMEFKKGLKGFQDEVHGVDREADRAIDHELDRRRAMASDHELADDPKADQMPEIRSTVVSDPQPDADPEESATGPAAKESDFVEGDPARDEVLGPRPGYGTGGPENEEFQSPDVPPRAPEDSNKPPTGEANRQEPGSRSGS